MAFILPSRAVSSLSKAIITSSLFDEQEWFIAAVRTFSPFGESARTASRIFWSRFSNKFGRSGVGVLKLAEYEPAIPGPDCRRLSACFAATAASSAFCCFISSALFLTSITESSFHVWCRRMMDVAGRCCNALARVASVQRRAA